MALAPVAPIPPATVTTATLAMASMAAWGTTLDTTPSLGTYATTGAEFMPAILGSGELASIGGGFASILGNGSGFGVCNSCRAGALGAAKSRSGRAFGNCCPEQRRFYVVGSGCALQ